MQRRADRNVLADADAGTRHAAIVGGVQAGSSQIELSAFDIGLGRQYLCLAASICGVRNTRALGLPLRLRLFHSAAACTPRACSSASSARAFSSVLVRCAEQSGSRYRLAAVIGRPWRSSRHLKNYLQLRPPRRKLVALVSFVYGLLRCQSCAIRLGRACIECLYRHWCRRRAAWCTLFGTRWVGENVLHTVIAAYTESDGQYNL